MMRSLSRTNSFIVCLLIAAGAFVFAGTDERQTAPALTLPNKPDSVRFAAFGDMGTGAKQQYETGKEMDIVHGLFKFDFVLMLGDNIYGHKTPADFKRKFEDVYKPLLDQGVKFYASLGNHDDPNERFYKPFNMNGKRYYKISAKGADFYALDSTYMDPAQLEWLKRELSASTAPWKICFFHHPLYSDARYHGADTDLRAQLEPIFQRYGVSVVLSGHEHVYERVQPHGGIYYFVSGSGGQLRPHDLRRSADTAKGFDTDQSFMIFEINHENLYFQTISRLGKTVDSGEIRCRCGKQ